LEELTAQVGGPAIAIAADVTDRDALVAAAARVKSDHGGADVLVNSAGVMLLGPFGSTSGKRPVAWWR
jgi:NAD(P)-dependent dehydrogenase (short-subunit alcohol dehydrogenase family)